MFGSFISTLAGSVDGFRAKVVLYIIVGVVAIVIINTLLDGIRKYIRGLDTAALGALLIWLGTLTSKLAFVKSITDLLYLVGGTLVAIGLIVFIVLKLIRGKRRAKNRYKAKHQEIKTEKGEEQ